MGYAISGGSRRYEIPLSAFRTILSPFYVCRVSTAYRLLLWQAVHLEYDIDVVLW